MSDSDYVKARMNAAIREQGRIGGLLAQIDFNLEQLAGTLLEIGATSANAQLNEAISLTMAIRTALELDLANLHVLGQNLVSYRDKL